MHCKKDLERQQLSYSEFQNTNEMNKDRTETSKSATGTSCQSLALEEKHNLVKINGATQV